MEVPQIQELANSKGSNKGPSCSYVSETSDEFYSKIYIYIYVVCLQWNDESKALVPLYLILKCLRVECVMETHLTVGAVAFCIGWTTRALQSDSICSPCQCLCQCNCACESSLGVGTILILLIGVGILGGLATLWYHRVYLSQTTSPTSAKGRKGVFGTQGKVLTLTG